AMILQSCFMSITEMSKRYYVPSVLVSDPFDNLAVVRKLECPVIVFHGRRDRIIPFAHGEALAKAARHGKLVAYDCDHNDCPPDWSEFMSAVQTFLRTHGVLRQTAETAPEKVRS